SGHVQFAAGSQQATERARPARGGDLVHDPAGRLESAADAIQRTDGYCGGDADCRTQTSRTGGADRLLRQYPGVADRGLGRVELSRAARSSARGLFGSLCAPGAAIRETGRGTTAGAKPELQPAISGLISLGKYSA